MSKTELVPASTKFQPDRNGGELSVISLEEEEKIIAVEQATAQEGGATVRVTTAVVEDKETELVETETFDRTVTQKQFHTRHVMMTNLYIEAMAVQNDPGDDNVEATCSGTDICCTCTFSNPFKRSRKRCTCTETMALTTDTLRRSQAKGWKMYRSAVFPLIRPAIRDTWVITELVLVSIGLTISIIATVSLNQNRTFNILHLALIILLSILALLDAILTLKKCEFAARRLKLHPRKLRGKMTQISQIQKTNAVARVRVIAAILTARIFLILHEWLLQKCFCTHFLSAISLRS